ncbi:MAG: nucleotidyl transferase AbiEii/AbiGii toxin family protein [Candidatus Omnitrophota bacterium]
MKDHCLELTARQSTPASKYNILREYAQAYVLKLLQDAGQFRHYAFVGGTALRFLYDLPRFSEDLDFSVVTPSPLAFGDLMARIKRDLLLAGYQADVVYNDTRTVWSAFIKFEGLLFEARLSPMKSAKFSIKVDIDTKPPAGAVVVTTLVNKFFPVAFLTYDLPSLFAGKTHAILCRTYIKGRDFYDVAWYLSRKKGLQPNMNLLAAALAQTGWAGEPVTEASWRKVLGQRVAQADWKVVERDVVNFLERPDDLQVLTRENLLALIGV